MKKTVLLVIAMATFSCSNDDSEDVKGCNCVKLIQSRTTTVNSSGETISVTPWNATGAGQVDTDIKDCSQDGKVVFTGSQSGQNKLIEFRHILKCN
jgi:hypothetical protein